MQIPSNEMCYESQLQKRGCKEYAYAQRGQGVQHVLPTPADMSRVQVCSAGHRISLRLCEQAFDPVLWKNESGTRYDATKISAAIFGKEQKQRLFQRSTMIRLWHIGTTARE